MNVYRLRAIDISLLDDVFEMGGGYVLDFSNKTFAEFMQEEMGVEIYNNRFAAEGDSKAKRLKYFLKSSHPRITANAIVKLWKYRETKNRRAGTDEPLSYAETEIRSLVANLRGQKTSTTNKVSKAFPSPSVSAEAANALTAKLVALSSLKPQPRGYAFEKFLNEAFETYGAIPRKPFKIVGEQIDGSFLLDNETYLLEAKWEASKTGFKDLIAFEGSVQNKSQWSRGVFVSYTGFSDTGLANFSAGKRIVCVDGLDLHSCLENEVGISELIRAKVRRASETGCPFVPYRELFYS